MVGIVIVSHSQKAAEGMAELAGMMARETKIAVAGGLEDGSLGTSYDRISHAIDSVYSDDGVAVVMDMGSAVMTVEMVIEDMPERKIIMLDCPALEGAVVAAVEAQLGADLESLQAKVDETRHMKKLDC